MASPDNESSDFHVVGKAFQEQKINIATCKLERLCEELVSVPVTLAPDSYGIVGGMARGGGPISALEAQHGIVVMLPTDFYQCPVMITGRRCVAEAVKAFEDAVNELRNKPTTVAVGILPKDFDLALGADRTHASILEEVFGVKVSASPEGQIKVEGPRCRAETVALCL